MNSLEDKELLELEKFINDIYNNMEVISDSYKLYGNKLLSILRSIWVLPRDLIDLEVKKKAYIIMLALENSDALDIVTRWNLLFDLVYPINTFQFYDEFICELWSAYKEFYKDIANIIIGTDSYERICWDEIRKEDHPIVIITSQFLSGGHAPTLSLLEIAYTLFAKYMIKVIIINESASHCGCGIKYNFEEELCGLRYFQYKGIDFPFYQAQNTMPHIKELSMLRNTVINIEPRLVLNIGGMSVLTDICVGTLKTACIPCSFDIPISMSKYLVLPRPRCIDDIKITTLFEDYQELVESNYNYIYYKKESLMHYQRNDFIIPQDAYVITIIGNRLDAELDKDFICLMEYILSTIDKVVFLVIGKVEYKERVLSILGGYSNRIIFAGSIKDSCSCMSFVDLYIQPKRSGGGRSAFEAIYNGVPVITVRYGDVWHVVGDEFTVEDYSEMGSEIIRYYNDQDFYKLMQIKARNRAMVLENIEDTISNFLSTIGV